MRRFLALITVTSMMTVGAWFVPSFGETKFRPLVCTPNVVSIDPPDVSVNRGVCPPIIDWEAIWTSDCDQIKGADLCYFAAFIQVQQQQCGQWVDIQSGCVSKTQSCPSMNVLWQVNPVVQTSYAVKIDGANLRAQLIVYSSDCVNLGTELSRSAYRYYTIP